MKRQLVICALLICSLLSALGQEDALRFLGEEPYTAYVPRGAAPGRVLYRLFASAVSDITGSNSNSITYSLVQSDPSHSTLFGVSTNGLVTTNAWFPSGFSGYRLLVRALSTQTGAAVETNVTVVLVSHTETSPRFEHSSLTVDVIENEPANIRVTIARAFSLTTCLDLAKGVYTLFGGNQNGAFSLDSTTGILSTTRPLDRENVAGYVLTVRYTDGVGFVEMLVEVIIGDINDNPPILSMALYQFTVDETVPAMTELGSIQSTDPDQGNNGSITIRFKDSSLTLFTIDSSGLIVLQGGLDYEQTPQYQLEVLITDMGSPSRSSTAYVIINLNNIDDTCPKFTASRYIKEIAFAGPASIPPLGPLVSVDAIDPDGLAPIVYNFVSGNESGYFSLDSSTGIVSLVNNAIGVRGLYNLVIAASDGTCQNENRTSVNVMISIGATDEHSPVLDKALCTVSIPENPPAGFLVTTLVATDEDFGPGGELQYGILDGVGERNLFTVDPDSGEVRTTNMSGAFDRERVDGYTIGVTATDGLYRRDLCLMEITLTDVNDNAPIFEVSIYNVSLLNDASVDSVVFQVQAYDPDSGDNGLIQYSLSSVAGCPFSIDPNNGSIIVSGLISLINFCQLSLAATDHGTPPLIGNSIINITLFQGGSLPEFEQTSYNADVMENFQTGMQISQLRTADLTHSYSIAHGLLYRFNRDQTFDISESNGLVFLDSQSIKGLDYESLFPGPYCFRLLVTAQATNGRFSITTLTVTVSDVNDNNPKFTDNSATVLIHEMTEPGLITVVQALDEDTGQNGMIVYNTANAAFSIAENGTLYSAVILSNTVHTVIVDASNEGSVFQSRLTVKVDVQDINEETPMFNSSAYTFSVSENQALYTKIAELPAMDGDRSDENRLVFTIISGNDNGIFQSTGSGQTGILKLNKHLDFESQQTIDLVVEVNDGLHNSTATVTIQVGNVDDEPPVFNEPSYSANIIENTALGTTILQVHTTDLDSDNVELELTGAAVGRLSVSVSGAITITGNIDREDFLPNGEMIFELFAIGGRFASTTVRVQISDLNDQVPSFRQSPFKGFVPENTPPGTDGLFAVQVVAVDDDAGSNGEILYSIVSSEDHGFRIDSTSGVITAHSQFDREERQYYTITVRAVDGGSPQLSSTADVIVEITDYNDNPPSWRYPYMYARVFENTREGEVAYTLPAGDPDNGTNGSVVFSLIATDAVGLFELNSTTGEILVNGSLDFEVRKTITLQFTVCDDGNASLCDATTGMLDIEILDANDNPPVFSNPNRIVLSLSENTVIGAIVDTFQASDVDVGSNGDVSYTIIGGNTAQSFALSVSDGMASVIVAKALDYESITSYELTIEATDGGFPSMSATATLRIDIADVNDEQPQFNQSVYNRAILENGVTMNIMTLVATDADDDAMPGGLVDHYSITSGNEQGNFEIVNGDRLRVTGPLDREVVSQYTLTIIAVDNDPVNPQTGTALVRIEVLDENDNPSFDGGHLDIVISANEGLMPTRSLGTVRFNDSDTQDRFINCTVVSGDVSKFTIKFSDCSIASAQSHQQEGIYQYTVMGEDGIHSPVTANVTIQVIIITIPPSILQNMLIFTINVSTSAYLTSIGSDALIGELASALQYDTTQIVNVSVQEGRIDPLQTTDVAIAIRRNDNQFVNPTLLIHQLFLQRNEIRFNSAQISSIPSDPCINEPCLNNARCTANITVQGTENMISTNTLIVYSPLVQNSYSCVCQVGSSGKLCETNYDDCFSSPCQNGGICTDGLRDYSCECPVGTSGKDCSVTNSECVSNVCQNGGTCRIGPSSLICDCNIGYYGNLCQYSTFKTSSQCDPNPCQNNATCSPGRNTYTCLCSEGFTGATCSTPADGSGNECASNPCFNGSDCTSTSAGINCVCSVGFTGPRCRFPLNNCELQPCRNGATCEAGLYGSYLCLCPLGFTGEDCTIPTEACSSSPCLNEGTCRNVANGGFVCDCPYEFTGSVCQYDLLPPDLCLNSMCNTTNGDCTSSQEGYTCNCDTGFSGRDCTIGSPPSSLCGSNPCLFGGSCIRVNETSYTCQCPPGFTGSNCEVNIDDCSTPNTCFNGGNCSDGVGGSLCACVSGFAGRQCEVECPLGRLGDRCEIDQNFCTPTSCNNGGTCIEEPQGVSCMCLPQYTGPDCELRNDCSRNRCNNEGICLDDGNLGYTCRCPTELQGRNCELLTISFQGNHSQPSYRAYSSLNTGGLVTVKFEFATQATSGLLMLNTQYQNRESTDFIAIEVVDGKLRVQYSLGSEQVTSTTVLGNSVSVSDGLWHTVEFTVNGKALSAKLDYCTMFSEQSLLLNTQCSSSVVASGNYSLLNLGLPLWLGGAPVSNISGLPIQSQGMEACLRNVHINGGIIDLRNHIAAQNTQEGCPQIDSSCDGSDCGTGTCSPQFLNHRCICPSQLKGEQCQEATVSVSFGGMSYAQFSLTDNTRTRRQIEQLSSSPTMSSFSEVVEMRIRTINSDGTLIRLQGSDNNGEHLLLRLSAGNLTASVNLGSHTATGRSQVVVNDQKWHSVRLNRTGLVLSIALDGTTVSSVEIIGLHPTLEYNKTGIFLAGSPDHNGGVADGYTGCIEDIRLNQNSLSLSGDSTFASVVFVGESTNEGCNVGPCFPNPCSPGNCTENVTAETILCLCPNGVNQTTRCDGAVQLPIGAIILAAAISLLAVILVAVLIAGIVFMIWRWRRKIKKHRIFNLPKQRNQHYEVHENIHRYTEEGGEADTNVDDQPVAEVSIHDINSIGMTSLSSSITTIDKVQPPRATTPDIDTFIEDRVNMANKDIKDIDSMKEYEDEGSLTRYSSLSSIASSNDEPYNISRLRTAGSVFQRIADLLEPVLTDYDSDSSS